MLNNLLLGQTAEEKLYVEDVFSTYLYTGNGSTQTITNGIDLAGKGGMTWLKNRVSTVGGMSHFITDTVRGANKALLFNTTDAQLSYSDVKSFSSTGFGIEYYSGALNRSGEAEVSWTFRKAPKFFDVVTYTGNAVSGRQISHNLGVSPGMIIIRNTSTAANWAVYHTSVGNTSALFMNANSAQSAWVGYFNNTSPTDNTFTLGDDASVNASGGLYIAYLFAHDATADGVVQCGAYTGNGSASGPTVNLGWEPQFIIIKKYNVAGDWQIFDNMRGIPTGSADPYLFANTSAAEATTNGDLIDLTPTGFVIKSANAQVNENGRNFIYLAIRRGPMRTPTDATKVFKTLTLTGSGSTPNSYQDLGFPPDFTMLNIRGASGEASPGLCKNRVADRVRGYPVGNIYAKSLLTYSTNAEFSNDGDADWLLPSAFQNSIKLSTSGFYNSLSNNIVFWNFRRAPGFFDVVCYNGVSNTLTLNHNLGVPPELIITKARTGTSSPEWHVAGAPLTGGFSGGNILNLNTTAAETYQNYFGNPTANTIFLQNPVARSGQTYVAYLFASCPGVSKVGTYTGNGSSQNIDCGFTNGARFVLIKRTNSTGDWYVWDTARGIVSANDPHLSLNTTAAEVTTNDSIDPLSSGFTVNQNATTNINVSGGTYLYLAIA